MNLYASIPQRKSCRKYDMQPLDRELLQKIENAVGGFAPLFSESALKWRFTKKVKGKFHVEAPHYLIISGQGAPGEKENTGFVFEQLALWFDAMGIGCVWLGESKDAETSDTGGDIIAIGFGRTTEPVHRERAQFKRKAIDKITNDPGDICMQAVHLAPSGMNMQPWYFERQAGEVRVYKQKLKAPISFLYKLADIDMGIALCHYALACKEAGKEFRFSRCAQLPDKPGFLPFGIIS